MYSFSNRYSSYTKMYELFDPVFDIVLMERYQLDII